MPSIVPFGGRDTELAHEFMNAMYEGIKGVSD
jgi:hypothetical protein